MKCDSAFTNQFAIEHILVQGVAKTIACSERTIGKFLFTTVLNPTVDPVQPIETFFKRNFIDAENFRQYCGSKFLAFDACALKGTAIILTQRLHVFQDHAAYAFRHLEVHFGKRSRQRPVAVNPMNVAAFVQEMQKPGDKKRMSFRLALYQSGQFAGEIVGSEAGVQITGDMFFFQQAEGDFFKEIVGLHPQLISLQRMVAALDFGGAIGSNDKHPQASDALTKMP